LLFLSENLPDLFDRAKDTVEIVWIGDENCDVLTLKLMRENFELRRGRDQNDLRLQRDQFFETRMSRVANFSDRLCFRRKVAITRSADKLTAATNSKNYLSQIGGQRNNAVNLKRHCDRSSGVVSQYS
jgi:hypothetical protein